MLKTLASYGPVMCSARCISYWVDIKIYIYNIYCSALARHVPSYLCLSKSRARSTVTLKSSISFCPLSTIIITDATSRESKGKWKQIK